MTETMHERKLEMYRRSDGFLMLPGGFGTMDEFFEMATWVQIGLHSKPIAVLNVDGYYDHLLKQCSHMMESGFLERKHHRNLIVANTVERVLFKMNTVESTKTNHMINTDQM